MIKSQPISLHFSYQLSDTDFRSLEIFKKRAEDFLNERQQLKPGIIEYSISKLQNGKLSGHASIPADRELKHLYLAFRFFYLKDELSNFHRIIKIIGRIIKNENVHEYMKFLKKQWKGSFVQDFTEFHSGTYTPDELINLWFNAHYFHSDIKKEARLNEINDVLSHDLSKAILYMAVHDAGLAVSNLYCSVKELNKTEGSFLVPTHLQSYKPNHYNASDFQ